MVSPRDIPEGGILHYLFCVLLVFFPYFEIIEVTVACDSIWV
jgi:hypothetical protein